MDNEVNNFEMFNLDKYVVLVITFKQGAHYTAVAILAN